MVNLQTCIEPNMPSETMSQTFISIYLFSVLWMRYAASDSLVLFTIHDSGIHSNPKRKNVCLDANKTWMPTINICIANSPSSRFISIFLFLRTARCSCSEFWMQPHPFIRIPWTCTKRKYFANIKWKIERAIVCGSIHRSFTRVLYLILV